MEISHSQGGFHPGTPFRPAHAASVHVTHDNNVRCEASRHFRNKKEEYLKATIDDLETKSKLTSIRDLYTVISDFKKGYQPRTTIGKDEKGDLVRNRHRILATWKTHIRQPFSVHSFSMLGRQTHTQQKH